MVLRGWFSRVKGWHQAAGGTAVGAGEGRVTWLFRQGTPFGRVDGGAGGRRRVVLRVVTVSDRLVVNLYLI